MKKAAWALGLIAAMSIQASAETPVPAGPAAPPAAGSAFGYEQRLAAMEQELEELKMARAEESAKVKAPGTFRAFWDKGLKFETADQAFKMQLGGRMDWDFGSISQSAKNRKAFGDIQDASEFRRLRVELGGELYECTYFKFQVDFGGGKVALKDTLIGVKGVPLFGNIQAGHFTEPFGLEERNSDKYDTFIEQSIATDTFVPARNVGIAFFNNWKERVTYGFGVFRDTDDTGTVVADDGYAVTGRVTALPWFEEDGRKLLHVGVGWRHSRPQDGTVRYEVRPEWHASTKKFVSTGDLKDVDSTDHLGLESALVCGPFSLHGEFYQAWVNRMADGGPDASFNGWYVEGSYWLTGENRAYDRKTGEFSRVSPKKNFNWKDRTWGAWQLAARYSELDLNDAGAGVAGGREKNITAGLNWHLDPNMRLQFNLVHALTEEPDRGDANMFVVRFHMDF